MLDNVSPTLFRPPKELQKRREENFGFYPKQQLLKKIFDEFHKEFNNIQSALVKKQIIYPYLLIKKGKNRIWTINRHGDTIIKGKNRIWRITTNIKAKKINNI